ncbi:MAG TPA: M14-type cytosolic carboxypeptidase [Humisphaera sp.]
MSRPLPLLALVLLTLAPHARAADAVRTDLVVRTDFPGGSAEVQAIDQQARSIKLLPTDHKGRGWRCWWHVRVSGITPGETLTLDVGDAPWATPDRATYSTDDGKTWRLTEPGKRAGKRIVYAVKVDAAEAQFAWGPPFTVADAEALAKEVAAKVDGKDGVRAEAFELCKTREGRSTPAVRLTPPAKEGAAKDRAGPFGVFVCARQHAWESGGSWVGRGFAEFLASDDPAARALRLKAAIVFVPVMDVDNVAIGAGGKNQDPHDHNRDWTDAPVFPAVAAAQRLIKGMGAAGGFDLFLDLHNPAASDRRPFFFTGADELLNDQGKANRERFLQLAIDHVTGPLKLDPKPRPSGPAYDKLWRQISGNWVVANTAPHVVGICLETSWNTPDSTTDGYRTVGRQLGQAVAAYFERDPRAARK